MRTCKIMCKTFSKYLAPLALALGLAAQSPVPKTVVKLLSARSWKTAAGVRLLLRFQIAPGYHVNAHHPSFDYLIPTAVKLLPAKGERLLKQQWPRPEQKKLSFMNAPLAVYSGVFPLRLLLRAPRGAVLRGELDYQACNDRLCLRPARLNFHARLK